MRDAKRKDDMPTQSFLEYRVYIGEEFPITNSGEAIRANHSVQLCACLLLHLGVERHRYEEGLE